MELNLIPAKNPHMFSTCKIPEKSHSLISFTSSTNFLPRSSKFRVHCCSNGGFPRENNAQTNPSRRVLPSKVEFLDPTSLGICPEPPAWSGRDEIRRLAVEQKANNVGIRRSLRFIKRERRPEADGVGDNASELGYSSVKNAISSVVFIIGEIQNFALMIRGGLCSEDLMAVMSEIQQDMALTFVCLFRHVFSKTPTLMVYVLLLLANFSVQSMAVDEAAIPRPVDVVTEDETVSVSDKGTGGEDQRLWKLSMVEEASRMRGELFYKTLGADQIRRSPPLQVALEPDEYDVRFRTDLVYQMCVAEEPDNALLLANYARFLHLVVKDYDRAEELYKRAIQADPQDSEALGLYADFLWQVRNDDGEAEEIYLEAMEVGQKNPFHASKYANFLWSTGGKGTCLVL
ncbi:hypothetical protein GQ457_05G032060 [Hibiscus cannabinus]